MKNTRISLDMLFVSADGRVIRVAPKAQPESLATITSMGMVTGVIEIAGGEAERLGIHNGDRVIHPAFGASFIIPKRYTPSPESLVSPITEPSHPGFEQRQHRRQVLAIGAPLPNPACTETSSELRCARRGDAAIAAKCCKVAQRTTPLEADELADAVRLRLRSRLSPIRVELLRSAFAAESRAVR